MYLFIIPVYCTTTKNASKLVNKTAPT